MIVKQVHRNDIKEFIEKYHYSKSINGVKVCYCFGLYNEDKLVGASLFGYLSTTAWKKYGEKEQDVIELRRLVTLDECPRNTESWFIARCLKIIKKENKHKICISYADRRFGHIGYIYQASNWNYLGVTPSDKVYVTPEGKEYHSRALRTKYKGEYKPFVKKLRELNDNGLLVVVDVPGKYIYSYNLVNKQIKNNKEYPKLGDKNIS
jgi:hypothetical protein